MLFHKFLPLPVLPGHFPYPVYHTVYPNGLNLFVIEQKDARDVCVRIASKYGSYHERTSGTCHKMEHLFTRRGVDIHPLLKKNYQNGSEDDGETQYFSSFYTLDGLSQHWPEILAYLIQIIFYPNFSNRDCKLELGPIRREIIENQIEDDFLCWVHKQIFPGIKKLHRSILGTKHTIAKIDAAVLNEFHSRYFNSRNAAIIVSGAVKYEEVAHMISMLSIPDGKKAEQIARTDPLILKDLKYIGREESGLLFYFAKPADLSAREEFCAGEIIRAILVEERGLLWQRLRTRRGLCYDFAFLENNAPIPYYEIRINANPRHFKKVRTQVMGALRQIRLKKFSDELFEGITNMLRKHLIQEDQKSDHSDLAEEICEGWLEGKDLRGQDEEKILDSVTPQEIADLAKKIFTPKKTGVIKIVEKGG